MQVVDQMRTVTRIESGYGETPPKFQTDKGIRCDTCYYWIRNGGCKIVSGKIAAFGYCNLWTADGALDMNYVSGEEASRILHGSLQDNRLTKTQGGYICRKTGNPESGKGVRCGTCKYFHGQGCGIVKGKLSDKACCNLQTFPGREIDFTYASGKQCHEKLSGEITDIEEMCA